MTALDKLRAICASATPGPWGHCTGNIYSTASPQDVINDDGFASEVDADFIAAARTALPALIELVEALEWKTECLQTLRGVMMDYEFINGVDELYANAQAAIAAVESARAKLEGVCNRSS